MAWKNIKCADCGKLFAISDAPLHDLPFKENDDGVKEIVICTYVSCIETYIGERCPQCQREVELNERKEKSKDSCCKQMYEARVKLETIEHNEYGWHVTEGGRSAPYVLGNIFFCPYCGKALAQKRCMIAQKMCNAT